MNFILRYIYLLLPDSIKNSLGKSKFLKPLRNLILRGKSGYRLITVNINRTYKDHTVFFKWRAPIKDATKAEQKGVETTLLNNTFDLMKQRGIKKDAIVFDVGANFGFLSMVWGLSVARGSGKVFSFEPGQNIHRVFQETLNLNVQQTTHIQLENLAVGRNSGEVLLNDFGKTSNTLELAGHSELSYKVSMTNIDEYVGLNNILRIDLLKIDVDGIELDILRGAFNSIKRFRPILVIETNNDAQIISFCKELGYQILDMRLQEYNSNNKIPDNIFCV